MRKLKRPLAWAGVIVFIMLRILCFLHPLKIYDDPYGSGHLCLAEGRVSDRYYKNDSYIIEIKNVCIKSYPADNKKSQVKKEYLRGAICYLKEDSSENLPHIGQAVALRAKKYTFERARNPGQFDMALYRAIHGNDISLMDAEILQRGKKYNLYLDGLKILKEEAGKICAEYLDEEDAGVVDAMLLGNRNNLDSDTKDLYKRAGIAHILSISGLHVSIIGLGFYKLLIRIRCHKYLAAGLSFAFVISYAEMVGGSSSVMRASVMLAVCISAEIIGRSYDILSAMSLSMIIILIISPSLSMDAGFLLSFGAVTGIALTESFCRKIISIKMPKLLLSILTGFSLSLFTLPIVLYFFFQIPAFSIFLNLIIVPLMTALLLAAMLLMLLGAFGTPLAYLPAYLCHIILVFYKICCRVFTEIPASVIVAGRPEFWKTVLYYAVFFALLIEIPRLKNMMIKVIFLFPGLFVMLALMFYHPNSGLEYMMLDIGQGDCNYLKSSSGRSYMIDCGSSDEKNIAKYKVVPALKSMGVSKIDTAVITHSDADHINGYTELFQMEKGEGLEIKTLLMPDIGEPDEAYRELAELAQSAGTEVLLIKKGDKFNDGEMSVECLNPEGKSIPEDANSGSTVLSIKYRNFSLLLTGDVQGENEKALTDEITGKYTILKVAHHGSKNSSPEELLEKIKPQYAFISCGRNNRYGHPHEETIKKLEKEKSKISVTAETGAIIVQTDGKEIKLRRFLEK